MTMMNRHCSKLLQSAMFSGISRTRALYAPPRSLTIRSTFSLEHHPWCHPPQASLLSSSALSSSRAYTTSSDLNSSNSQTTTTTTANNNNNNNINQEDKLNNKRRRLLLNSRNRGRVETELFLGGFAQEHIWSMNPEQLEEFNQILNESDADLFLWLTGMNPIPDDLSSNETLHRVLEYIAQKRQVHYVAKEAKTFNSDYDTTDLVPPSSTSSVSSHGGDSATATKQ